MKTAKELQAWIDKELNALSGPPTAYFSIPLRTGGVECFTYRVLAAASQASEDREAACVAILHTEFKAILKLPIHRQLYWRSPPDYMETTIQLYGKLLATLEEVQDGVKTVPANAVRKEENRCWYENAGRINEGNIYCRFCIPSFNWVEWTSEWEKKQGEPIRIIT